MSILVDITSWYLYLNQYLKDNRTIAKDITTKEIETIGLEDQDERFLQFIHQLGPCYGPINLPYFTDVYLPNLYAGISAQIQKIKNSPWDQ